MRVSAEKPRPNKKRLKSLEKMLHRMDCMVTVNKHKQQTSTSLHMTVILQALWHASPSSEGQEQTRYKFRRGGYKITTVVIGC